MCDPTIATMSQWSLTLTEPLLGLGARAKLEDDLSSLHHRDPETVHLFFAGLVSDLAQTLPTTDPWRSLSGRIGAVESGENAPAENGATWPNGRVFGAFSDCTDLTPLSFSSPAEDPELCAVAPGLSAISAAILASGFSGWEKCFTMITSAFDNAPAAPPSNDVFTRLGYQRGVALHQSRGGAQEAVRWLVHRRRAWVGRDDQWPSESAFRWAWRAARQAKGKEWNPADVEAALVTELVHKTYAPHDSTF